MKQPDLERVKELFGAASDLLPGERAAFLDAQDGLDAETRAWVEGQLAALGESESALLLGPQWSESQLHVSAGGDAYPSNAPLPEQVGPYRILSRLGEGGFGVVYLAEESGAVHRKVALKLVKPGMDSDEVLARFAAERQAVALMDHPSVARVFDAGAMPTGQPYFSMEYVDGIPITRFADEQALTIRERLGLVVQVCRAVQHAHGRGIIHRDLKPANLLVTCVDGRPLPKVIDFGIAKATGGKGIIADAFQTLAGQVIGTPEYMSPEQCEGSLGGIDIRADVYSLGAVLYELLTGCTPLDLRQALSKGASEMMRVLRDRNPVPPSSRVRSDPVTSSKTARSRGVSPRRLPRMLRGDLDWIVLKALEKDRERRYETAEALASDLERYLRNEPVSARAPSFAYRLRKVVSRNKLATAAIAFVLLALLAGLGVSSWGLLRAREESERSSEAVSILAQLLDVANPDVSSDPAATLEKLQHAEQRLLQVLPGDPETEFAVRRSLGTTYWSLGELRRAEVQLTSAIALADQVSKVDRFELHDLRWTVALLTYQRALGDDLVYNDMLRSASRLIGEGLTDEAGEPLADRLLGIYWSTYYQDLLFRHEWRDYEEIEARLVDQGDSVSSGRWRVYADWLLLSGTSVSMGRDQRDLGSRLIRRALTIYRDRCQLRENNSRLTIATYLLLSSEAETERLEPAIAVAREALARTMIVLGEEHWLVSLFHAWLGSLLARGGHYAEAEAHLREGAAALLRLLGPASNMRLEALRDLVDVYRETGDTRRQDEASRSLAEATLSLRALQAPRTPSEARRLFSPRHEKLASALGELLEGDHSSEERRIGLAHALRAAQALPAEEASVRVLAAEGLITWIEDHDDLLGTPEREATLRWGLEVNAAQGRPALKALIAIARGHGHAEEFDHAAARIREAMTTLQADPSFVNQKRWSAELKARLGFFVLREGQVEEALPLLSEAVEAMRGCYAPGAVLLSWALSSKAQAHLRLGQLERCAPVLREHLEEILRLDLVPIQGGFNALNNYAWWLVVSPKLSRADYELARRGVERARAQGLVNATTWNTLGVARYRCGDDEGAIEALRESIAGNGVGGVLDWIPLTLALHRAGRVREAQDAWAEATRLLNEGVAPLELESFLSEAAQAEFRLRRIESEESSKGEGEGSGV